VGFRWTCSWMKGHSWGSLRHRPCALRHGLRLLRGAARRARRIPDALLVESALPPGNPAPRRGLHRRHLAGAMRGDAQAIESRRDSSTPGTRLQVCQKVPPPRPLGWGVGDGVASLVGSGSDLAVPRRPLRDARWSTDARSVRARPPPAGRGSRRPRRTGSHQMPNHGVLETRREPRDAERLPAAIGRTIFGEESSDSPTRSSRPVPGAFSSIMEGGRRGCALLMTRFYRNWLGGRPAVVAAAEQGGLSPRSQAVAPGIRDSRGHHPFDHPFTGPPSSGGIRTKAGTGPGNRPSSTNPSSGIHPPLTPQPSIEPAKTGGVCVPRSPFQCPVIPAPLRSSRSSCRPPFLRSALAASVSWDGEAAADVRQRPELERRRRPDGRG
jgi:hypothetical protein